MITVFWWIRRQFKLLVSRHLRLFCVVEFCKRCGRRQPLVWHVTDDLWLEVIGQPEGVYCPECFNALAAEKRMLLYWTAKSHEVETRQGR